MPGTILLPSLLPLCWCFLSGEGGEDLLGGLGTHGILYNMPGLYGTAPAWNGCIQLWVEGHVNC